MSNGKGPPEVVRFLTLYSKLREWCDDDPGALFQLAISDEQFRKLCRETLWAAESLHASERGQRQLFAAPVDLRFLSEWRDFEARYEHLLKANHLTFLFREVNPKTTDRSKEIAGSNRKWEHADMNGNIAADFIEKLIGFARERAAGYEEEKFSDYSMDTVEWVETAINYWEGLIQEIGFDLGAVFRRRLLVPFVFFPRHIATRYKTAETTLLYQNLQQAHDAFIFGVPFAALALMRSIMETVLRDHYQAQGNDLSERISSVRRVLPADANEASLHRLRKLANAVLHHTIEDESLAKFEPPQLEREILSLLLVLRALIEGAPPREPRHPKRLG